MPDLFTITAQFPGSEWQDALSTRLREPAAATALAGRLLHDEVGQLLSAAGLQLGLLAEDMSGRVPELSARAYEIQATLDRAMTFVREASRELNPPAVDGAGLKMALDILLDEIRGALPGGATLDFPGDLLIPRPAATALCQVGERCTRYVCQCGARAVHLRVRKQLGWVLEVLYDRTSPRPVADIDAAGRCGLLLLCFHAIRAGVSVELDDAPDGAARMCITYSAGCGIPDTR